MEQAAMNWDETYRCKSLLLEKIQEVSIAMLASATTAMSIRNPQSQPCFAEMAGGYLGFSGPDVPLTRAVGVGTAGPLERTDISRVEAFYESRQAPVRLSI